MHNSRAAPPRFVSAHPLMDAVGVPLLVVKHEWVIFANAAARLLLPSAFEAAAPYPFIEMIHPDSQDALQRWWHNGYRRRLDVRLIDQPTGSLWADVTCEKIIFEEEEAWLFTLIDTTPYAMALNTLDEIHQQLYMISENSVDVITLTDSNGNITFETPSIERLVGYTSDERRGESAWKNIHPEDLSSVLAAGANMWNSSDTMRFEFRSRHKDGHYVWLESNARMVRQMDEITGIIAVTRDITERRRIAEALQRSERLLQETGRIARVGGWEYDLLTDEITWTREMYTILEMPPEFVPRPDNIAQFYTAASIHIFEQTLADTIIKGTSYDLETEMQTGKGMSIWVRSIGTPVVHNGTVVKILGVFQDISVLKAAEAALRRSDQLYRSIASNFPNGAIVIFDRDLNCVLAEGQLFRGKTLRPEHFQAETFQQLFPELGELIETVCTPVLAGVADNREVSMPSGDYFLNTVPLREEDGSITQVMMTILDITRRKQAEAALRRSEQRYRTLFEQTTDAVFILDLNGVHVDTNAQASRMLGYTPEEIRTLSFRQTIVMDQISQSEGILGRLLAGEALRPYERIFRRKDGSHLPAEVNVQLIRDENGKPAYIQSVVRDITERKRTEDALRESEARYRLLAENMTDLISLHDDKGRMTYVSPSFIHFTGYSQEDLLGRTPRKFTNSEDMERVLQTGYRQVMTGRSVQRLEFRLRKKSDEVVWVGANATPILDESGSVSQILVTTRDISVQHQMQQALLESSKRFRMVIDNSSDVLIMINIRGEIIYISPSVERITGYHKDEVLDASAATLMLKYLHPDDLNEQIEQFQQMLASQPKRPPSNTVVEIRFMHKDGHYIWLESSATNLLHERGVEAVVVNIRDITERMHVLEIERRQRALAQALLVSSSALNSTLEFDEVVEVLLHNVGLVIPHDWANLMLIANGLTRIVGCKGYDPDHIPLLERSRLLVQDTYNLRLMYETREPFIVPDTHTFPGWVEDMAPHDVRCLVSAPVVVDDEVLGFINLDSRTPHFFTQNHAETLKVFAAQAALAIKNTRAYEQAQELAAVNERQRLARDLHDAVSQTLFSASVIAETLPLLMDHNPSETRIGLDQLTRLTKGALAEMRTLLVELRPKALVETDLSILLTNLINSLRTRTDALIALKIDGAEWPLASDVKINLYRITQEALNNIIKHANAYSIDVMLVFAREGVTLSVTDDGRGFDKNQAAQGRLGLNIMRERAEAANILLQITSEIGRGTRVTARWMETKQ